MYVFPSFVDDTHVVGLVLDVVPIFLCLQEKLTALEFSI
jgi:hypothetical protein